ncbi:MAG: AAA family ATPase [Chloroflexi bacterium]|nr:AAA family ATPase [Chloroflexota bacterium]
MVDTGKGRLQIEITDDLDAMLAALPPHIADSLRKQGDRDELLEVVMDLGRVPEARYHSRETVLSPIDIMPEDIDYVVARISAFGDDNRAGIERTLHRISAIRNRKGRIVGLTCRVGRAVFGTIKIVEDIIQSGKSILLLGRPGVGKTTMLREVARVLADDFNKRVIIVDTSNEIGGDGDIPHPAIGRARRMQVPTPTMQHAVMIEAVENHMPEVIVIDEIGTELEAQAARTIAERGVQLIGTAHGNTLENLMMNPTLADLIGGIQTVTLGDEEARRRGTQKSILERKAPPSFQILVEIQSWYRVAVHSDVAQVVDGILRGQEVPAERRELTENGELSRQPEPPVAAAEGYNLCPIKPLTPAPGKVTRVYPLGISRARLIQAAGDLHVPMSIVSDVSQADVLMTLKAHYRRKPTAVRNAEAAGVPIYVLRNNTVLQIEQCLSNLGQAKSPEDAFAQAMRETQEAISQTMDTGEPVELSPQNAYIRRLQHQMAERYKLSSRSMGRDPHRHVTIFRDHEAESAGGG